MADKGLYNPLSDDFSYEWLDDTNTSHILIIPAHELRYFPSSQYQFMKRHLADAILHERGVKVNPQAALEEIHKELENYESSK